MFYFKPPGGRGQTLHQDNFYLEVKPDTCMAAWIAVDDVDSGNGGLSLVPASHRETVQCPHPADLSRSFAVEEVDIPTGMPEPEPTVLQASNVLFFNGSVIHGSHPNSSRDCFRRLFICHYVPVSTGEMREFYYPLHTFNGEPVWRAASDGGGPCGTEGTAALLAKSAAAAAGR